MPVRSLSSPILRWPGRADLFVYTAHEWRSALEEGSKFVIRLERETVWLFPEDGK
jgi:hypothetical protein